MRQEEGNIFEAWSISESRMTNNQWARDSFLVELIDNGDGYYWIRSKHGRYIDMRQEEGDIQNARSISEYHMKTTQWARDSFVVKLIDNGDGYFFVKSKYGRYLDMRQEDGDIQNAWSISESHMINNQWTRDSFVVLFVRA